MPLPCVTVWDDGVADTEKSGVCAPSWTNLATDGTPELSTRNSM
jgi:hypothetical protein